MSERLESATAIWGIGGWAGLRPGCGLIFELAVGLVSKAAGWSVSELSGSWAAARILMAARGPDGVVMEGDVAYSRLFIDH